jgi:hypothetical protein
MKLAMRRGLVVIAVAAVSLLACALAIVQKVDDGYLIVIGDRFIDPVGEVKLALTRHTRNCALVVRHSADAPRVAALKRFIDGKGADEKSLPRAAWTYGDWVLVESDFVNREPAIVLLKSDGHARYVVASIYGGSAAPFNEAQAIHEQFHQEAPGAPTQLIDCYEPASAPVK